MNHFFWIGCGLALCAAYLGGTLSADWTAKQRAKRAKDAEPFPEPEPDEAAEVDDGEDDVDIDICLRVGMRVTCRLSESSHTHGVLIGFAMDSTAGRPMLAMVDVGRGAPPMPIDVDMVEPAGKPEREAGYRESADPSKQWN